MNDLVLAVEIDAEADAVFADPPYPNLSVPALYTKRVKDAMLIGGTRRCVLVAEAALGKAELDVPPIGEGLGLPIAHHGCGVRSSEPAFPAMVYYHVITSIFNSDVIKNSSKSKSFL